MKIASMPYEWNFQLTAQTEWIERRGLLLWLAFFFGGAGSGLYLWSLFSHSLLGMFMAWLIVGFGKGITHLLFLGKPWRFWRGVMKPQTSWLSRGYWFMILFLVFAGLQIALMYFSPGTEAESWLAVLAAIFAFFNGFYEGFVMNSLAAIPFWNTALLPMLFIVEFILSGTGIALLIGLTAGAGMNIEVLEWGGRILLPVIAVILPLYLIGASYGTAGAKASVRSLLIGPAGFSLPFWVLVIVGIIIPLALTGGSFFLAQKASNTLLLIGIACELIGSLALRYSILRAGIYNPLLPSSDLG